MTIVMVPPPDAEPYPTLGAYVCQFIEENLVYGPGDLFGQDVVLTPEQKAWIYRLYEVEREYVVTSTGRARSKAKNPRAGRRRFERCALSLRKGSSKTEFAAWIAACELHHEGPVRCAGFAVVRGVRVPIWQPVSDPYIPMISYTEEQTEELAYGALRRVLEESRIATDFDIGLDRIMRGRGDGKAEPVSGSPNARDGARTTFQHADETHRLALDHLKRAWTVMLANLAKRPLADPWALETTTAPEPGTGSVAETTMEYAQQVAQREDVSRSRLFFFHREASESHDLGKDTGLRAAIVEASGPHIAEWSDLDRIIEQFRQPDADLAYLERVWLNRCVQASAKAFDVPRWRALKVAQPVTVARGTIISLGFDGSRYDDGTGLIGTRVSDGYQWVLGVWERPATAREGTWEVPAAEVDGVVSDAFGRYRVLRMYCDPPKWEGWIATWAGRWGDKRVFEWWTNRRKQMAYAIRAYIAAIASSELSHSGDPVWDRHMGHACRLYTNLFDEHDKPLWILRKDRPDSPNKIDLAVAAVLSMEARNDAIAAGEVPTGRWVPVTQEA